MAKYTEAQKLAVARYQKKKYDDIRFRVPKGYRESTLAPAAKEAGLSMNEFIKRAIEEKIERDGLLQDRETDRADDPLLDGPDEELPPFDL